jgi:hypothetical protein
MAYIVKNYMTELSHKSALLQALTNTMASLRTMFDCGCIFDRNDDGAIVYERMFIEFLNKFSGNVNDRLSISGMRSTVVNSIYHQNSGMIIVDLYSYDLV